jgi:hypothetical protein
VIQKTVICPCCRTKLAEERTNASGFVSFRLYMESPLSIAQLAPGVHSLCGKCPRCKTILKIEYNQTLTIMA